MLSHFTTSFPPFSFLLKYFYFDSFFYVVLFLNGIFFDLIAPPPSNCLPNLQQFRNMLGMVKKMNVVAISNFIFYLFKEKMNIII